jgi:hypothetical protein
MSIKNQLIGLTYWFIVNVFEIVIGNYILLMFHSMALALI